MTSDKIMGLIAEHDEMQRQRDALQARLDEAVELLRRYLCDLDSFSETQRQIDQAAHAFLTLHTPKGGK